MRLSLSIALILFIFFAAPQRIAETKNKLVKPQSSWQLYELLILNTIRVDNLSNKNFVATLKQWQQSADLPATGILDHASWLKMVEQWQIRRSKDRTIPPPEKLVTVAASEFYDPERPVDLRMVERETYAAYQRMIAAAAKELQLPLDADGKIAAAEKSLKIISAFRSPEYQKKLRQLSPNSGRAALAVNSPHFTGRALDLFVGGDPVSTKDANRAIQVNTKAYRWLVKNAEKFGFIPYFYEPWHWEYNPQAVK
jgi:zinc D-Ala-D-Ala carboxypeptidase